MLHTWKEDYTRQSQPPARGAPLGEQKVGVFGSFLAHSPTQVTNR